MESQEESQFVKIVDDTVSQENVNVGVTLEASADDIKLNSDSAGVDMNNSEPPKEPCVEMEIDENDIVSNLPFSQPDVNNDSEDINMQSHVTESESTLGIRSIFSSTLNESLLNQSSAQLQFTMNASNLSHHNSPLNVSNKGITSLPCSDLTPKKNIDITVDGNLEAEDQNIKPMIPLAMFNNVFYQDKNDATPIQLTKRQKFSISPFVQNNQLNMPQSVSFAQNQSIKDASANSPVVMNNLLKSLNESASRKILFESSSTPASGGSNKSTITISTEEIELLDEVKDEPSFIPLNSVMETEICISNISTPSVQMFTNNSQVSNTESNLNKSVMNTNESTIGVEQVQSVDKDQPEDIISNVNVSNVNTLAGNDKNLSKIDLSLNNSELLSSEGIMNINEVLKVNVNSGTMLSEPILNNVEKSGSNVNKSLNSLESGIEIHQSINGGTPEIIASSSIDVVSSNTEKNVSNSNKSFNCSKLTLMEETINVCTSENVGNTAEADFSLSSAKVNMSQIEIAQDVSISVEDSTINKSLQNDLHVSTDEHVPKTTTFVVGDGNSSGIETLHNPMEENTSFISSPIETFETIADNSLEKSDTLQNYSVLNSSMGIDTLYTINVYTSENVANTSEADLSLSNAEANMSENESAHDVSISVKDSTPQIPDESPNFNESFDNIAINKSLQNDLHVSTDESVPKAITFVIGDGNNPGIETLQDPTNENTSLITSSIETSDTNADKSAEKSETLLNISDLNSTMGINILYKSSNEESLANNNISQNISLLSHTVINEAITVPMDIHPGIPEAIANVNTSSIDLVSGNNENNVYNFNESFNCSKSTLMEETHIISQSINEKTSETATEANLSLSNTKVNMSQNQSAHDVSMSVEDSTLHQIPDRSSNVGVTTDECVPASSGIETLNNFMSENTSLVTSFIVTSETDADKSSEKSEILLNNSDLNSTMGINILHKSSNEDSIADDNTSQHISLLDHTVSNEAIIVPMDIQPEIHGDIPVVEMTSENTSAVYASEMKSDNGASKVETSFSSYELNFSEIDKHKSMNENTLLIDNSEDNSYTNVHSIMSIADMSLNTLPLNCSSRDKCITEVPPEIDTTPQSTAVVVHPEGSESIGESSLTCYAESLVEIPQTNANNTLTEIGKSSTSSGFLDSSKDIKSPPEEIVYVDGKRDKNISENTMSHESLELHSPGSTPDSVSLHNTSLVPAEGIEGKSTLNLEMSLDVSALNSSTVNDHLDKFTSASLDETSMCALDYSLPLSDCTNLASKSLLSTKKDYYQLSNSTALFSLTRKSIGDFDKSPSEKDLSIKSTNSVDGDITPVKSANNSGLVWDSFMNERSCLPMRKSLNITRLTSEERRLLSESINKSIRSENLLPHDEIISLKENLFLVMDLLEEENSEFEAFKKVCENEKSQLMSKISLLEEQIATLKKDSYFPNSDNEKKIVEEKLRVKEEELSELMAQYILADENLKQATNDLEYLRNLFVLTETEIPQFSELLSSLNSYGVTTDGALIEGSQNLINLKNILNILSSLLMKHNSLVSSFNELLENSKEDKSKLAALEEAVRSISQKEKEVTELQDKCTQLQSTLECNQNLVTDLQAQLLSFNELKDSLEKYKGDSEAMKENISKLNDELALSLEKNSEVTSNYEILTQELHQAITKYDSLKTENNELLNNYEKTSERLINLEEIERKYSELEKYCESLEAFKTDYDSIKDDFTKLREDLKSSSKNSTEMSSTCQNLTDELNDLYKKYESLKIENDELLSKYEKTSERVTNLEEVERKYLELEKQYESLEAFRNDYDLLKENFSKLEEEFSLSLEKNSEFSTKCETLGKELIESIAQLQSTKNEKDELLIKYEKCMNDLVHFENIERKYSELEQQFESLESRQVEFDLLKEEFSKLKEEFSLAENRNSEMSSKCVALAKELDESAERCQSLKIENDDLWHKYQKCKEDIANLEDMEKKVLELEEHCEGLTENCKTFEESLCKKVNECDEFYKQNQHLQNEIYRLNELLDETKKVTEQEALDLKEICLSLKQKFNEQSHSLDNKVSEVDLLIEANDIIRGQIESMKGMIELNSEDSLFPKLELKSLLLQFEEINLKYNMLDNIKTQLKHNYEEASERINALENNLAQETESKNRYLEEISVLNARVIESSENLSELQKKYDYVLSQNNSDSTRLACLVEEIEELKFKYNESLLNLAKLEEMCSEKTENNKLLEDTVSALNLNIKEKEETLSVVKNDYEALISKYETEFSDFKTLQNNHALLEKHFAEASSTIEDLKKLSSDRGDIIEKNKIEINSLLEEVNKLNENLLELNKQFEAKYVVECEKVSTLQNDLATLLEKYEDSSATIEKLQREFAEKCEDNEKLDKDLASLNLELSETKENLSKLRADYDVSLLNIKNGCSKLMSLEKEHSDLQIKFDELFKEKEAMETEYISIVEKNDKILSDLESSELKLNQITEELINLKNDHNNILFKLENTTSELSALQSEYSKLDLKYIETVTAKEILEKESAEKDVLNSKLEEERKLKNEEYTSLQTNFDALASEHEEMRAKYDNKCSESALLLTDKIEFESKYNEALTNIEELQGVCSSKSELNEKLCQEILDLKNELTALKGDFESAESKLKEMSALYVEEQSKYETLKHDHDKLHSELGEASAKVKHLESECLSSSESNQSLFEEVSRLKLEILNMGDSLSDLKNEYDGLSVKYNDECAKRLGIQSLYEGLEVNYKESLMWVKELTKESLGELWEEMNYLQTHESHYDQFSSALSSIKTLKEQSSTNMEINGSLRKEIDLLKEKSSTNERELIELKKDYEFLQNKFEEENSKCTILQEQLKDIEMKYANTMSKLAALEDDITNKNLENDELQSQNTGLKNNITELSNYQTKLQEDMKIITEKNNSLDQECENMKKEIENLFVEKTLREDLERRSADLQAKCETLEEDLASKVKNLEKLESEYHSLEQKLSNERQSLLGENEQLNKQISQFSVKIEHLSSNLENLQLKNVCLEEDLERKHSELRNAALKIENFKYYEELIQNIKSDYPFFVKKFYESELTYSENSVFDAFFPSVERVLKEFSRVGDEYDTNKSLLVQTQEEVDKLREELKSLHESLQESHSRLSEVTASYDSLQEKYTTLMGTHTSIKEKYDSLCQLAEVLRKENTDLQGLNQKLANQVEEKTVTVKNLQDVHHKYESLVSTYNDTMSMLSEISRENENMKQTLFENNQQLSTLEMELKKNMEEVTSLREDKSTLKNEFERSSLKVNNLTADIEKLEAENKQIRAEKLKYEKEYQNVVDTLRKTQEEMCEIEKKCNEKMSRFTYVLKEKEDFENETLSLLKQNDELTSKIKNLSAKVEDYEKAYIKLQELQSAYSLLSKEKSILEAQVSELPKYKNEIIDLKANLATKDSKMNEILNEKKQMKINYQQKSEENQELVEKVCSLLPGVSSFTEALKAIEDKMNQMKAIQEALEEEKAKCESLDEECNVLNTDLQYKDKVIGDMYQEHSAEIEKLKKSLEKAEETNKEQLFENDSLKGKLRSLEKDLEELKTSQPSLCKDCAQLKESLEKAETDLCENKTKVSSLEKHLELFQSSYKKKIAEYRKKLEALDHSQKKYKKSNEENLAEIEQFKEKVKALEKELTGLKSSGTAPCVSCAELAKVKADLDERNTKITSLEKHLEHFQVSYKKKTGEYKKKIFSLQEKLASKDKNGDENKEPEKNPSLEVECQTEASPLHLTSETGGIVQSAKIVEQEEKLHRMEKENQILKKICHERLHTIREMQAKYENRSSKVDSKKAASRSVLSEVKNN